MFGTVSWPDRTLAVSWMWPEVHQLATLLRIMLLSEATVDTLNVSLCQSSEQGFLGLGVYVGDEDAA